MVSKLEDKDWSLLLSRIRDGKCTPIIGGGISLATEQRYAQIAEKWAEECGFPILGAEQDLIRVSQFSTVFYGDEMFPKEKLVKELELLQSPDFSIPDEPHSVLADLPLPIYLTTNYHNFMTLALKHRKRDPKVELCHWDPEVNYPPSIFQSASGFEPTAANPIVFHFHGKADLAESLVLTEDDHIDFLVNVSKDESLIPPLIQRAIATSSLLLLGYNPSDWSLRVIFQGIVRSRMNRKMSRISVTVQIPPISEDPNDPRQQNLQEYFDKYFGGVGIRAYWGTTKEFAAELRQRWKDFSDAS